MAPILSTKAADCLYHSDIGVRTVKSLKPKQLFRRRGTTEEEGATRDIKAEADSDKHRNCAIEFAPGQYQILKNIASTRG